MTPVISAPQLDLTACEREPIHIPGSIQSHGVLFACRHEDWRITHVSGSAEMLGMGAAATLIGTNLTALLGSSIIKHLTSTPLVETDVTSIPLRVFDQKIKGQTRRFDITIHAWHSFRLIELEPAVSEGPVAALDLVRGILSKLQLSRKLSDLCDQTVIHLRDMIGFDRVMIYRFLDTGVGEVVAESREPALEPMLHLRYPASDVPRQARELYKRNWVRLIADVQSAPSNLLADPGCSDTPLDLTFAGLRSVSPIHIEYLKNMNVGASMSISIMVGGELWGLIACHHGTAKHVPSNVRAAAELLGQVFSLQIQTVEGIEAYVTMRAARALLDRVVAEFPVQGELIDNLSQRLEQLASFINCDGIGIWIDGVWRGFGITPPATEIMPLIQEIDGLRDREIFVSQHLSEIYPRAASWSSDIAGLLAVPLSQIRGDYLIFFRKEVAQTIAWGGDPAKAGTADAGAIRLSPRKSFAAWREEVRGQSLPWSSRERLIGDTLRVYLLDIIVRFTDVILEERRQSQQRTRLVTNELNHRVKGTLELIRSLVTTAATDGSMPDFVRALEGRIGAIALAHDAVALGNGSDVQGLIESAFAAQSAAIDQIEVAGASVKLDAKAYTVLALVVHELASNALQFGALSTPHGHLIVRWAVTVNGLTLTWDELGGPSLRAPAHPGLGLNIIRRNIPHSLGGEADVQFEKAGLKARFSIPARFLESVPVVDIGDTHRLAHTNAHRPLEGFELLVLEDQMLLAIELEAMLRQHGAGAVELAGTVEKALEVIERRQPDAAVLDVDLGDETAFAVAEELERRAIPFVFAASEFDRQFIPQHFNAVAVVSKPYSGDTVADAIHDSLMPHLIRAVLTKLV
ncbi:MAG: GAF domain-containing protein [Hyphomicrobium sp.]